MSEVSTCRLNSRSLSPLRFPRCPASSMRTSRSVSPMPYQEISIDRQAGSHGVVLLAKGLSSARCLTARIRLDTGRGDCARGMGTRPFARQPSFSRRRCHRSLPVLRTHAQCLSGRGPESGLSDFPWRRAAPGAGSRRPFWRQLSTCPIRQQVGSPCLADRCRPCPSRDGNRVLSSLKTR
jgi:hypothetical protein